MTDVEGTHDVDAVEHASEEISKQEGRASVKLWFAILGSPLAWAGHLILNYSLEEWFACSRSSETPGEILGLRVQTVSILINTAMLLIAAASGLVAYACWRSLRKASEDEHLDQQASGDERLDRARWMAFAGIVEGALFVGIILLGYLPALTLHACEHAP